jgi:hypothetical protein
MLARLLACTLLALTIATHSSNSNAGRSCEEKPADPNRIMQGFELAEKLKQTLDSSSADVAIVARVGQDLSQYHVYYSHLGIVRRGADGSWIVMHELNQCGTADSGLFDEGLANFFMDDPFRYEAMILLPSEAIQKRLRTVLTSPLAKRLHEPKYNMMAFAFSTQYQNSNQWALEVLASALSTDLPIENRTQAQAWLRMMSYQADTIELSTLTRLGARMFRANVSFDDHPFGRRMAGQIDTVTVDSIARFLRKRDPQLQTLTIILPSNNAQAGSLTPVQSRLDLK